MKNSRKRTKRIIASALTALFLVNQTMTLSVFASNITGVTNGGHGTFNIDPTHKNGNAGFRHYNDFDLDKGDIANLNFNDINTFINMVDNQIKINGIVNSMRGNGFYNGKAVFISPNGMVVGASGVLNVGSLGVYTPSNGVYEKYKANPTTDLTEVEKSSGHGAVKVDGKIITNGEVQIYGGQVDIAKGAGIVTGINKDAMELLSSNERADALFNQLVNTDNIKSGNNFIASAENGTIYIKSQDGINVNGKIVNRASGDGSKVHIHNWGENGLNVTGDIVNTKGLMQFDNNRGDLNISGNIKNDGETNIYNNPFGQLNPVDPNTSLTISGNIDTKGQLNIKNKGGKGLNISGTVNHDGNADVQNGYLANDFGYDKENTKNNTGAMNITGTFNTTGDATFLNTEHGVDGMNISGTVNVGGKGTYTNHGAGGLNIKEGGNISSNNLAMLNTGAAGLNINGSAKNNGTATVTNKAGKLVIGGSFVNNGDATFTNTDNSKDLEISGTLTNNDGKLVIDNQKAGHLNITGNVANNGTTTDIINAGDDGLNVLEKGKVHSNGRLTMTNTGANGIILDSEARITGNDDVIINNTIANKRSEGLYNKDEKIGNVNIKGKINAKNNVKITSTNGNVVIGDNTDNNNYVTAGKNIDINTNNGSILNYGTIKTLLNAGGDLTMNVVDGTIGESVQQEACKGTGCTGVGPQSNGSRDFTKSINGNIKGKVNATTNKVNKPDDLVINYAAIDSDMNIDKIKADGKVILTVDDLGHILGGENAASGSGRRYNMVNASSSKNGTNIEGKGISLIANGSIGAKDNMITFIQTDADNYKMDGLANENIYLKENSFNEYGRNGEVTKNSVCTMIAREGDMYLEFAGNTTIDNVTAEGDMTIITRGQNLEITNLGHIDDPAIINGEDYFGPHHDGYEFDKGYDKDDYKSEILPNKVVVKALDINHNIRPTEELVDGGHEAWAGSTVRIKNAVLDNGTLDITADHVYANGVVAHFGKEGFSKEADPSTNPVIGASETPMGHAVRPEDVEEVGRDEKERNYYVDDLEEPDTPLELDDDNDNDNDNDDDPNIDDGADGRQTFIQRKILDDNVDSIDKRQFMRYNVSDNKNPIAIEPGNGVEGLLDVSRGGISVVHNNELKVGDVVPVHISYGGLDIQADVKVVTSTSHRAGAMFVNLDQATANQLLYLNMILEDVNGNNITFNP